MPITVFSTTGDRRSFLEDSLSINDCLFFQLKTDHYHVLKPSGVDELINIIKKQANYEVLPWELHPETV